ncbi:hypothetical protein E2R56_22510 [Rhodococcus qingshengii]|nr:hypothetical protein E2R56_22510 [Rhodococcus qingshengii]
MSITGDANSGPAKAGMSIVDLTTGCLQLMVF